MDDDKLEYLKDKFQELFELKDFVTTLEKDNKFPDMLQYYRQRKEVLEEYLIQLAHTALSNEKGEENNE